MTYYLLTCVQIVSNLTFHNYYIMHSSFVHLLQHPRFCRLPRLIAWIVWYAVLYRASKMTGAHPLSRLTSKSSFLGTSSSSNPHSTHLMLGNVVKHFSDLQVLLKISWLHFINGCQYCFQISHTQCDTHGKFSSQTLKGILKSDKCDTQTLSGILKCEFLFPEATAVGDR